MASMIRVHLPTRLVAASLAATFAALGGAVSDSHSSTTAPRLTALGVTHLAGKPAAVSGRVRIEVRFRGPGKGAFEIGGAISDRGSAKATQRVANGRLQVTELLAGRLGTIRVRSVSRCGKAAGTWRVLSGSGDYAGLSGGGATSGGPRCAGTRYPVRAIHTGTVRTPEPPPPPPIGQTGRYGGGTSQREEVVLDVDQGARTVSGLRLVVTAPCEGATVPARRVSISLSGPYQVGRDQSFSVPVESWWTGGVTGRFTNDTTVEGMAEVKTTLTVSGTTYPCAASVTWRASLPPPAATPGTYCGSTHRGSAICLDVAASGREVSRVEVGVVARCLPSGEFELKLRFTTPMRIGGNLGFSQQATSFEGLVSGRASVSGLFDSDGAGVAGRVVLFSASFDYEGRRYACPSASATWQAKRQT